MSPWSGRDGLPLPGPNSEGGGRSGGVSGDHGGWKAVPVGAKRVEPVGARKEEELEGAAGSGGGAGHVRAFCVEEGTHDGGKGQGGSAAGEEGSGGRGWRWL